MEKEVKQRQQTEEALAEAEQEKAIILDSLSELVIFQDLDHRMIWVNKASGESVGLSPEQFVGRCCHEVWGESSEPCVGCPLEKVRQTGKPQAAEMTTPDGRTWYVRGYPVRDAKGEISSMVEVVEDITERKQAEEEITRLAKFPNENPAPVMRIAQDGTIRYANKAALPLLNKWKCQVGQILPEYWREFVLNVLHSGSRKEVEVNVDKRIFTVTFAPIAGEDYVNLYGLDITERKTAEEALQESEENFRGLAESITDVFFAFDKDLRYTYWNKASEELTGVSAKDALGKHFHDLFPASETTETIERMYLKALKTQQVQRLITEFQFGGKDYFFEINAYPSKDGLSVFVKDVTESKQAEEALRENEAFRSGLLANSPIPINVINPDGSLRYVSPALERLTGFSAEELIGQKPPYPYWPKEALLENTKTFKKAMRYGGERVTQLFKRKDGERFWVEITSTPVKKDGKLQYLLASWVDITERKQAEEALRESEAFQSGLLANSPVPINVINPDFSIRYVSPALERLTGFSAEELLWRKPPYPYWSKEDRAKDMRGLKRALRQGGRGILKHYKKKNGERFWVEITSTPVKKDGKLQYLLASWVDITERKQAEERLRDEATRHRILIDQSSDGIVILDEKGKVYEANQKFAEMLGYTPEEVRKLSVWDWEFQYPPEQVAEMIKSVGPEGDHFETRHRRKDGTAFDVAISTNGAVYGGQKLIFCVCRDITERKQAEAALKDSEEKYKTLVEATSDIIWEVDGEGRFTFVSPKIKDVLGYEVEEVVGKKRMLDLIAKGEARKWLKRFKEINAKSMPFFGLEITYLHKNGSPVIFETSGIPLFDSEGKFRGYVGISRDITERKKMQEQLVITDRLASVGELAAGIAHELNNPLTGVIGFSQLLLDKEMPEDIKEDIKVVYGEAQRTSQVVKNLLTFARKHTAVKEKVNINDVIQKVLELRAYEQNLENITVDARLEPELPEVMADYFQLQQVFLNIIINAEYFMKEAHNRGKLTITTERVGNKVKAFFADDGPGIAEDDLGHLFDPFFTTKEVGEGTGLGLSICHGIVAEHGGKIYVESEPGKGATFIVELPISAAEEKGGAV